KMTSETPRRKGDQQSGRNAPPGHRPGSRKWKNTSQTFKKEVCLQDRPCSRLGRSREHVCCKCRARFRGRLPVPRAEAALPYWVPLSLRPRKQILKTVQSPVSTPTMACLCLCHRFGGLLPVPREQAVMPYWVPRGLRSQQQ
uniref:Uncharacterized protein n=2 Tax=Cavia porcellus TaxID=10141 RepID=A0A286XZ72_CAVPO